MVNVNHGFPLVERVKRLEDVMGTRASFDEHLARYEAKLDDWMVQQADKDARLHRRLDAISAKLGIVERRGSQAEIFARTLWSQARDPKNIRAFVFAVLTAAGGYFAHEVSTPPPRLPAPVIITAAPTSSIERDDASAPRR